MRLNVSDGKYEGEAVVIPTAVVSGPTDSSKLLTKKRIISAVVAILVSAIVVTGIVVGIWIFTEQQRLMLQYTQNLVNNDGSKASQDVSTNKDENVVQYHVVKDNTEWWIVEDFNKNIKVAKVQDGSGVVKCLVSGLDEAQAQQPSDITAKSPQDQSADDAVSSAEMMTIAQDQVKDSSFLGKTASNLCANTPVYWTYKACFNTTTHSPESRDKRATLLCTPCGCGYKVCLYYGSVYYYYYFDGYTWHCSWNVNYYTAYGYYVFTC